jgi:hypothetical protein
MMPALSSCTSSRCQHEEHAIGQQSHVCLALADAHGLEDHRVEELGQQPAHLEARGAEPAQLARRRLAAEEDAPLAVRGSHPRAVAEQRAAGDRAARIDRQHGQRQLAVRGQELDANARD